MFHFLLPLDIFWVTAFFSLTLSLFRSVVFNFIIIVNTPSFLTLTLISCFIPFQPDKTHDVFLLKVQYLFLDLTYDLHRDCFLCLWLEYILCCIWMECSVNIYYIVKYSQTSVIPYCFQMGWSGYSWRGMLQFPNDVGLILGFVFYLQVWYYFLNNFFKDSIYLFLEGKGVRKRWRETSRCGCLLCAPNWGCGLQHKHVPWL